MIDLLQTHCEHLPDVKDKPAKAGAPHTTSRSSIVAFESSSGELSRAFLQ